MRKAVIDLLVERLVTIAMHVVHHDANDTDRETAWEKKRLCEEFKRALAEDDHSGGSVEMPTKTERRYAKTADRHIIRKGMWLFSVFTQDGGKTWAVDAGREVMHTNARGMCAFESPVQWWHQFQHKGRCVGDNRLFASRSKALAEAEKRNNRERWPMRALSRLALCQAV